MAIFVPEVGIEPTRLLRTQDFESSASTIPPLGRATAANIQIFRIPAATALDEVRTSEPAEPCILKRSGKIRKGGRPQGVWGRPSPQQRIGPARLPFRHSGRRRLQIYAKFLGCNIARADIAASVRRIMITFDSQINRNFSVSRSAMLAENSCRLLVHLPIFIHFCFPYCFYERDL